MSDVTKKALAASLKKLMNKTSLEKITVKSVVIDCGVNRQTFYYHFKDIYDLLDWIYKKEVIDNIDQYKSYGSWKDGILKIFEYISNNKIFCTNTFHSLAREHLEKFLYDVAFNFFYYIVEDLIKEGKISRFSIERKKFIVNFFTYGFMGILIEWLKSGMKENPQSIVENISLIINEDMIESFNKKL